MRGADCPPAHTARKSPAATSTFLLRNACYNKGKGLAEGAAGDGLAPAPLKTMANTDALPTPLTPATQPESPVLAPKKPKKDKVRSAWISFAGRIVAQVVGASASVLLGIVVVQQYNALAAGRAAHAGEEPVAARARSAHGPVAIAVLPLDNFTGDPAQQHLADGLTEALIADLAQARHLKVISRTSVMRYKGERKPLIDIARELDVDVVVEGSVARAGDRIRVTAQLIDGRSDEHLWARAYDRTVENVLSRDDDVASAIAGDLLQTVPGGPRGQ